MAEKQTLHVNFPEQGMLPFRPSEDHRGVPTAAIWSALFAPIRRGARAAVEREEIPAVGGIKIVYTGFRLDQGDLDVFEQVLYLAASSKLGRVVKFKTREFLKAIGRNPSGANREWLLRALARLQAHAVEISKVGSSRIYSGSLIEKQGRDELAGVHYIVLDPELSSLFQHGWSIIRWKERLALAGQPLAQWLHGFAAMMTKPLTFNTVDLMGFANSGYQRARDFREALDRAAELTKSCGTTIRLKWSDGYERVTIWKERSGDQDATGNSGRAFHLPRSFV